MIFRTGILCLLTALSCGCANNIVSVDAKDSSVSYTNLEASFRIDSDRARRIRVRATSVGGSFDQFVETDKRIETTDGRIDGPANVDGDVDLTYYSIAIGSELVGDGETIGGVTGSYYLGLAWTDFDLALASAGSTLETSDDTEGFYFQYVISINATESLQYGLTWAITLGRNFSGIREIDLFLDYEVAPQFRIVGGYRWFDNSVDEDFDESVIEVEFRGPFLGLRLPF